MLNILKSKKLPALNLQYYVKYGTIDYRYRMVQQKNKWTKVNLVKSHRGGKDYHDETVQETELHYEG